MAGVSTEQGSGSLNVELNLVPFIDLLSSLTLFLLVTAVWLQVSAIPASVSAKGKSAIVQAESDRVRVRVTAAGYSIAWPASLSGHALPQALGHDAQKLSLVMKKAAAFAKGRFPVTALAGDDDVSYEAVIQALDAIKSTGVGVVGLSTD